MTAEPSPTPIWLRRLRAPFLGLLPTLLSIVAYQFIQRTEIGLNYVMEVQTLLMFSVVFSLTFLLIWFVFFSGLRPIVRYGCLAFLIVLCIGMYAITAKLEFTGNFQPQITWIWETTAEKQLTEYLQNRLKASEPALLQIGPTDSPQFRGLHGDGHATHLKLNLDWTNNPPKLLWRHPVGQGHGGIAVAGNSAITMEQRGGEECIVCYDRLTGKERWVHQYQAHFQQSEPMGGSGPRTTPVIHDGLVVALGATGELTCLDGATGQRRWQTNILKDAAADNIDWGMSGSPIIVNNIVIVTPGTNKDRRSPHSVAGYDLSTGQRLWSTANRTAGYASPMSVRLAGTPQVLAFDGLALAGFDPSSGRELWKHPWPTAMNMNSAQPVVVDETRVFIGSEKSNGGALLEVTKSTDSWNVREVWKNRHLSARYCSPLVAKDHLFGLCEGRLVCLEAKTGKRKWAEGSFGNGQLVLAQNSILLTAEDGTLYCIDINTEELKILGELKVFDARTWNVPAVAGNQIVLRNHREIAAYELAELK